MSDIGSVLDKYIRKKDMKERLSWTNREKRARVEKRKRREETIAKE